MANWFQKLTRRLQRPSVADQRGAPGTPPQQWTVTGIRFDTAGWTLVDATPARMSWSSPNGTLVLSREEDQQQAETIGLTALRDQRRADARADCPGTTSVRWTLCAPQSPKRWSASGAAASTP